jgi:predicted Zn-dependent protease
MTELTLDQALQKGIEAHKAGRVQEADRLYTAILKAQPKHPDANHNMGVLAVGVGKVQEALPFFKTALEANPATAQYWLNYIDALIKLDKFADAKAVFDQAKSKGAKGDGFDELEQRLNEAGGEPLETTNTGPEEKSE